MTVGVRPGVLATPLRLDRPGGPVPSSRLDRPSTPPGASGGDPDGPDVVGGHGHIPSHRARLVPAVPGVPGGGPGVPAAGVAGASVAGDARARPQTLLDAVVVPAYRSPAHLAAAADVAATAGDGSGALLLLMCSGGVNARQAVAAVQRRYPRGSRPDRMTIVAVDVHPGLAAHPNYPQLFTGNLAQSTQSEAVRPWQRHDANLKRNLGIMLARMLGWQRLLFHNDDVSGLTAAELARTMALLDGPGGSVAAGWAYREFPDNSVVCHAHRLGGGTQDTFISDATLAVRVSTRLPFFPAVYNEDWLFLLPLLRRGEVALAGDDLPQEEYDPFADPRRAVAEEFGDVLGEGLLRLEHLEDRGMTAWHPSFWRQELRHRARFIGDVAARVPRSDPRHPAVLRCLAAARRQHGPDWPEALARYVRRWQDDLVRWEKTLCELDPGDDLPTALGRLGLDSVSLVVEP